MADHRPTIHYKNSRNFRVCYRKILIKGIFFFFFFIFRKKKSKVYWNFKLQLKNPNPNPGDIHQDKVSESGKCSLPQNPLETSSLSTSPRHRRVKAILLSFLCPQKDTRKPIVLFTRKFSTNIFQNKFFQWQCEVLADLLSTPFYVVSTSEWWVWHSKENLTCFQGAGGARAAAARHLWLHSEAGPLPAFTLESYLTYRTNWINLVNKHSQRISLKR